MSASRKTPPRRRAALAALLAAALAAPAQAEEVRRIGPEDLPPEAPCLVPSVPRPNPGQHEGPFGRLAAGKRAMVRALDPLELLKSAALQRLAARDLAGPPRDVIERNAEAYSDLAVSGDGNYQRLEELRLTRAALAARLLPRLREALPAEVATSDIASAIAGAVDRAYDAAWALRGPVGLRESMRPGLGWIAVSGEDDRPARPVNVASAPYPQRSIALNVQGQTITLRVVFMHPEIDDWRTGPPDLARLPPRQPPPPVSGDVILFLHGAASAAEEATELAHALFDLAAARGRDVTVLSLDLPGIGFSSTVDTAADLFARMPMETQPNTYPGLVFIEEALDALVATLDILQPGFGGRVDAVVGGSLGGNLGLRLAGKVRSPGRFDWVRSVVAWSPASVWPSFADACADRGDAHSCTTYGFSAAHAQRKLALSATFEMARDRFHDGKRGRFYYSSWPPLPGSQYLIADRWFSPGFACGPAYILASKWTTGEYFGEGYSRWHWRLANEQLVFSHWDPPAPLLGPARDAPRLLMMAGEDDEEKPEYLYSNAMALGAAMVRNPGWTLDLADTGHSVHAERPRFLARTIMDFLYGPAARRRLDPAVISAVTRPHP